MFSNIINKITYCGTVTIRKPFPNIFCYLDASTCLYPPANCAPPAHPGCTKCTKCTISAPPPFLDIKSPVYLPGAGGGREGGVPGHPPGAPPCTRSCEGLGPKAPKNTLFRGLSTPPTPRAGAPFPGGKPPILRSTSVPGDPPRHREESGVVWCGVVRSVKHECTRASDRVSDRSRAGAPQLITSRDRSSDDGSSEAIDH